MVTVGYYLFHLLSHEQLKSLSENQFLALDYEKLRKSIRFYLYFNEKVEASNENLKENYIEIKPLYLLLSKELTQTFGEIFKLKSKGTNNIGSHFAASSGTPSQIIDNAMGVYTSEYQLIKYFSVLVLESLGNTSFLPQKLRYAHIINLEKPSEGEKVYMMSSPYGLVSPILYKNTVNITQISKVASKPAKKSMLNGNNRKGCIFLINVTSKEGEEGAPIFDKDYQVIGLALGSISPTS